MVVEEVKRNCARSSHKATQETVENAVLDHFIFRHVEEKGGLRTTSYQFVETELTDMTEKGA